MDPRDERGIVVGWIVRVLLGLAVAGLVLFDLGSITVNYFGLDSTANDIAQDVSLQISQVRAFDERQAEARAEAMARDADARLVSLDLDRTTDTLTIVLRRRASTLFAHRIGALDGWVRPTAEAQAPTN
jgi:hypothetical protein